MIGKEFLSRVSKFTTKKKTDHVFKEITLTYESTENLQDFLDSWDETFNLNLTHSFRSSTVEWTSIDYKIRIPMLTIQFDALKINADLNKIKVTRKETMEEEIFKYDLIFYKELNRDDDYLLDEVYYKRTEEDEEGKQVFLKYDTLITK